MSAAQVGEVAPDALGQSAYHPSAKTGARRRSVRVEAGTIVLDFEHEAAAAVGQCDPHFARFGGGVAVLAGVADRNIPPKAMAFMAERARARKVVTAPGASHVVMVSHPNEVSALIEDAANDR